MLRSLIALFCAAVLPSCAFRHGTEPGGGSYTALNIGIREEGVVQAAGVYVAKKATGEKSFQEAGSVAKIGLVTAGLVDLASAGVNAYKASQATKTAGIKANAATQQAATAADVQKTAILNPVEE